MNTELIDQLGNQLGANGLPYIIPIHPNLVHLTLGLFIVAIGFDFVGVFFVLEKPLFKFMAIPAARSNFFDVGWYNMIAASIVTSFTVGAGFYEVLLASRDRNARGAWGFQAMETMIWHGVGGVLLLALIVGMTVWRGFQRFVWRKDLARQVQWSYLVAGLFIFAIMFAHGTLGAQLASEFGVHITADRLLRVGKDIDLNKLLQ